MESLTHERRKKADGSDDNDGSRKNSVDYYKLVSDEKRSLYTKLRTEHPISVSNANNIRLIRAMVKLA